MKQALVLTILTAAALRAASNEVPDWVRQAAAQTVPSYSAKITSVVLLNEEMLTVNPDGSRVMRERSVVKILQPGGQSIRAEREYDTKAGRIRDFQGWLIPPTGKPVPYAKNQIVDIALGTENLYDETRAKVLDFGNPPPGSVMAWEATEEEKTIFTQSGYGFQGRDPVLDARFVLNLPASWETRGQVFNHAPLDPVVAGNTSTWELRELAPIEREDFSPAMHEMAPFLVVNFYPPAGAPAALHGLKSWAEVSNWLSPMVDPQADLTDSIRAKAMELTAKAPGELEKIAAIAKFAQQTNYVEISLNVERAGGIIPRRASDSLAKNYGDCKDKATLMRALLKAAGIDSYLIIIYSGDRLHVRPEWASADQFNHAIIAVRVSEAVKLPTVLPETPVGRLLIFDPTDSVTPVGDLPEDEQASYALLVAGAQGALLKMPLLPLESQRVESLMEASMDENGRLEARLERQYFGQAGTGLRYVQLKRGNDVMKKAVERGFTRRVGGTTLTRVATEDRPENGRLTLNVDLSAEQFGQVMQGKLLVVRPGLLSNTGEYYFNTRQRTTPVRLEAGLRRDSIRIKLPAGFKLDEIPQPTKVESPYGTLSASWTVKDNEIQMEQTLEVKDTVAPAADFAKVRSFFDQVAGAQGAPVVLVKQ